MSAKPIHIYEVPIGDIRDTANGLNVRRTDRDAEIQELAKSIESRGLLQPILLRGQQGKPPYDLMAGHRVELNHADTAQAITFLFRKYHRNAHRVAREWSLSLATVRDYIPMEEQASEHAKQLLRERKVKKADGQRARVAAQGDLQKADRLLEKLPEWYGQEKKRAVEYARQPPQASAGSILEEGKKARQTQTVVWDIDPDVDGALDKAEKDLYRNRSPVQNVRIRTAHETS